MAGKPGRSGGWNRLPVEQHVFRGTYRRDRHGPKPGPLSAAPVVPMPAREAEWTPRPRDVAKLWPASKALLRAVRERYRAQPGRGRAAPARLVGADAHRGAPGRN